MTRSEPRRVLLFGNSGAGKSTLARRLHQTEGLAHLDLDTLAWLDCSPPERRRVEDSQSDIDDFVRVNSAWVIEGCYADLLALAAPLATELIWLNPDTETCVGHALARPWEPHKYASKAAQDANLPMLIDWIRAYDTREDEFSRKTHAALFEGFSGAKRELTQAETYAE